VSDPSARPKQTLDGGGDAWKAQPNYNWAPVAAGKGLGFTSPVLTKDSVIVGSSSANLWVQSSKADTDLQVGVSEVRPDGKETLVQDGWLRASHRKLDAAKSTALSPFPTHLQGDASNLPSGDYTLVRVPVYAFGHVFRAGSRIRITVMAPGGDRQIWDFDTIEDGTTTNRLSLGGSKPSAVVLPVIPAATAKGTSLPPATALRGQPSRTYSAATNGG
jgi:predicted acyl esterase